MNIHRKLLRAPLAAALVLSLFGSLPVAPAQAATNRVAILPFTTPKNKPDLEQYGLGTMDTLIQALANVPDFQMIDRARIESIIKEQQFAQTGLVDAKNAVKVGKLVGAQTLVTGNLVQAGDKVRITAHFTDMKTGQITKSEVVTGPVNNIFDLMDQLASKFIKQQGVTLTAQEQVRVSAVTKATASIGAYDFYLKGRTEFLTFTAPATRAAIRWYEQAIESDPKYALAYAGASEAWSYVGLFKVIVGDDTSQGDFNKAYELSKKALSINPDLPEAMRALALVGPDSDQPIEVIKRALTLKPNDGETWLYYWIRETLSNGFPPDHQYLKKALELNPDLILGHLMRGIGLSNAQRFAEAEGEYREALRVNPNLAIAHFLRALPLARLGRRDEALEEVKLSLQLDPTFAEAHHAMARVLYAQGDYAGALHELQETLRLNPKHKEAAEFMPEVQSKL